MPEIPIGNVNTISKNPNSLGRKYLQDPAIMAKRTAVEQDYKKRVDTALAGGATKGKIEFNVTAGKSTLTEAEQQELAAFAIYAKAHGNNIEWQFDSVNNKLVAEIEKISQPITPETLAKGMVECHNWKPPVDALMLASALRDDTIAQLSSLGVDSELIKFIELHRNDLLSEASGPNGSADARNVLTVLVDMTHHTGPPLSDISVLSEQAQTGAINFLVESVAKTLGLNPAVAADKFKIDLYKKIMRDELSMKSTGKITSFKEVQDELKFGKSADLQTYMETVQQEQIKVILEDLKIARKNKLLQFGKEDLAHHDPSTGRALELILNYSDKDVEKYYGDYIKANASGLDLRDLHDALSAANAQATSFNSSYSRVARLLPKNAQEWARIKRDLHISLGEEFLKTINPKIQQEKVDEAIKAVKSACNAKDASFDPMKCMNSFAEFVKELMIGLGLISANQFVGELPRPGY